MTEKPSSPLKLLVTIASFGTGGDKFLAKLIEQYQAMPLDVRIIVLSNIDKPLPPRVELRVGMPTNDPWSLPFAHKKVLAEYVNDYDLFIYSEDDTLVTKKNIEAFLEVSAVLEEGEIPGFLRYENGKNGVRNYISAHDHYHWEPYSTCKRGPYTFAFLTNEHAAFYLVTQKQLKRIIEAGSFLVAPYKGKYDLACTAATDPYTSGGLRKLICLSRLEDFLIHHLPDKYTPDTFDIHDQEFGKQIQSLLDIADKKTAAISLLQTETKLPASRYSKQYYEPARLEAMNLVPANVKNILSVGAGSGKTEKCWVKKGLRVTAIPLDSVIGSALQDSEVELVNGGLEESFKILQSRKFDCLYLSNVLHLMPDPQKTLTEFVSLLNPGGVVLVITPNMATLKNSASRFLGKPAYRDMGDFEKSGVQHVSIWTLKSWLRQAGCRVEHTKWMATPRFHKFIKLNTGMFGPLFGYEFISLARKTVQ